MKEWTTNDPNHFIIVDVHDYETGKYFLQYEYEGQVISEVFVNK